MYSSSGFIKRYGRGRGSHDHMDAHYNKTFDYCVVVKEAIKTRSFGIQPISLQQILAFAREHYMIRADPDRAKLIQAILELQVKDFIRCIGDQIYMETRIFKERFRDVFQIATPQQQFHRNFGNGNRGIVESNNNVRNGDKNGDRLPNLNALSISKPKPPEPSQSRSIPVKKRFGSGRFKHFEYDF